MQLSGIRKDCSETINLKPFSCTLSFLRFFPSRINNEVHLKNQSGRIQLYVEKSQCLMQITFLFCNLHSLKMYVMHLKMLTK